MIGGYRSAPGITQAEAFVGVNEHGAAPAEDADVRATERPPCHYSPPLLD